MLELDHISLSIEDTDIIKDLSYAFEAGKIYALLGKNGSGKSSLAFGIFGHPRYRVRGSVKLDTQEIHNLSPHELAQKGMFLSFQNVPEIPGIRLIEYLRTIYNHDFQSKNPTLKLPTPFVFRRMVEKMLLLYGIDPKFLDRDLYVGFS
jgi:Fe-S cluster assembly ATP-binding protein